MTSVSLCLGNEVSYGGWAFGFDDKGIAYVGGILALRKNGRLCLWWLRCDLTLFGCPFKTSSFDMPRFYFFGHSNDANRPLLRLHLNPFIQTHDWFLKYMKKGSFSGGNSSTIAISNDWKHVSSLETKFGSEKDLTGIAPIVGVRGLSHWHVAIYLLM